MISFYNGVRYDTCDTTLQFDKSPYKISLTEDYDLDIPVTMVNLEKYRATLGHKVKFLKKWPIEMLSNSQYFWNTIFPLMNIALAHSQSVSH